VGVACRYPGDVGSLDELWTMVKERRNACFEVPLSRWDADALLASVDGPPDAALHDVVRCGGGCPFIAPWAHRSPSLRGVYRTASDWKGL
jgi:acyl transferase domain-containing protein